mmetsp:Transcript_158/g.410  ORF Transcript_158/g.410 Transcript_158/m.410 type:complete len:92 (+) Transcript_158:251-526(+)
MIICVGWHLFFGDCTPHDCLHSMLKSPRKPIYFRMISTLSYFTCEMHVTLYLTSAVGSQSFDFGTAYIFSRSEISSYDPQKKGIRWWRAVG